MRAAITIAPAARRRLALPLLFAAVVALAGCSSTDSDTAKRTGIGGVMGAIGGTAIGAATGSYLTGAAVGAGAGLVGGFVYDRYKKAQTDSEPETVTE